MHAKLITRLAGFAAIGALLLTPLSTATANAAPTRPAGSHGTNLTKVEWMYAGDYFSSADGGFTVEMQADGNLVEYQHFSGGSRKACWATNTNGQPGDYVVYQQDGNLVVYDTNKNARWASNTAGRAGTTVDIAMSLQQYGFLYVGVTQINTTVNGSFHC